MPLRLPTWAQRMLRVQGIRYITVAGATATYYLSLVALGMWFGWHYFLAILTAQAITIATAFPVYRKFVFESRGRLVPDFFRFLSVWLTGLIAGLAITPLLVELLSWPAFEAQVVAVAAIGIGSFAGHRWFSFRTKSGEADASLQVRVESESR